MLRQVLVGAAVSVCNIAIHAFVMAPCYGRRASPLRSKRHVKTLRLITVMIAAVSLLMAAHFRRGARLGIGLPIVGAAPEGTDLVYFAFVNYTTLGTAT